MFFFLNSHRESLQVFTRETALAQNLKTMIEHAYHISIGI